MEGLLNRSILENRPLEVIYQSSKGAFTQRTLMVKSFNDTYVMAFCLMRRKVRVFKRCNILSARLKSSKKLSDA
ncbi:WYL domain-containing protein [Halalkalibacterium ligniniphilum]|uniref:WYL domain-containing protein n=1 Tax=Halalkalibacterium ligniniphilum TaxID=1134413 RepID=UPI00037DDDF3|nr:hypothetical protein [Halalkalibacterium ligniniphilum]